MQKNVASQKLIVYAFDSTTNLPKTGDAANLTAYVSKDYGAVTVLGDTSATEMDSTNAKGYYLFDLTQSETNADTLLFSAKSSTANIVVIGVPATVFTTPPNFSLQSIDSNGRVDVIKIAGTTQTARDIGASVLLSSGTGTGQLDFTSGVVKANVTQFNGVAATSAGGRPEVNTTHAAGTAWASGAITSAVFAADAITAAKVAADVSTEIATAVWQDSTAGDFTVASSIGKCLYVGNIAPGASGGHFIAGSNAATTVNFTGNLSGSVGSIASGGIVAASFAADSITSTAIAASAANEIAQSTCTAMINYDTGLTAANVVLNSVLQVAMGAMFAVNSAYDFSGAVAQSPVYEIANNTSVSGAGVVSIAETTCQKMITFDTSLDTTSIVARSVLDNTMQATFRYNTGGNPTSDIASGSAMFLTLAGMFTVDTTYTYASSVAGSPVQETANNAESGPTVAQIMAGLFTTNTGLDYTDIATGSPFRGLLRATVAYNTGLTYLSDLATNSLVWNTGNYTYDSIYSGSIIDDIANTTCFNFLTVDLGFGPAGISSTSAAAIVLGGMITFPTGFTYANTVPQAVVYEIATNSGGSNPWDTVIDGGYTATEVLRAIVASTSCIRDVSGNTVTFFGMDGVTPRIVGTTNAEGDRTSVTFSL